MDWVIIMANCDIIVIYGLVADVSIYIHSTYIKKNRRCRELIKVNYS